MVPVLRDADRLALRRDREGDRRAWPKKARDGKIAVADLQGGTFTITNGGIFGSLLSHADPEPAAERHPRHARDPEAAGRRRTTRS